MKSQAGQAKRLLGVFCSEDWKEVDSGRIVRRSRQVVAGYHVAEMRAKTPKSRSINFQAFECAIASSGRLQMATN
jgi:hypothetical protein